mmetsp:Transcript_17493/g.52502  ORF Transcript_17493/g.52502 Transcript_17493/m.52502 type:complete len:335 (+) Transcript_17493:3350-4354(+)
MVVGALAAGPVMPAPLSVSSFRMTLGAAGRDFTFCFGAVLAGRSAINASRGSTSSSLPVSILSSVFTGTRSGFAGLGAAPAAALFPAMKASRGSTSSSSSAPPSGFKAGRPLLAAAPPPAAPPPAAKGSSSSDSSSSNDHFLKPAEGPSAASGSPAADAPAVPMRAGDEELPPVLLRCDACQASMRFRRFSISASRSIASLARRASSRASAIAAASATSFAFRRSVARSALRRASSRPRDGSSRPRRLRCCSRLLLRGLPPPLPPSLPSPSPSRRLRLCRRSSPTEPSRLRLRWRLRLSAFLSEGLSPGLRLRSSLRCLPLLPPPSLLEGSLLW